MKYLLEEPLNQYLVEKKQPLTENKLAKKFRQDFPNAIKKIIEDKSRYKVVGSTGKGVWTECPWIAILDSLITNSPQSGYYPVFLFKADMTGVYLSLNQGVTEVKDYYKKDSKNVLSIRAKDFRAKLDLSADYVYEIDLMSDTLNAKLYEAGNIVAKYYPTDSLPSDDTLEKDILRFVNLYESLTFNDNQIEVDSSLSAVEKKQYRLHYRIERNNSLAHKVKQNKGYTCEACRFDFVSKYGSIGEKFIEAHHLVPLSTLAVGKFKIDIDKDFAVLCSNCHSMIHRLPNPSDIEALRRVITSGNCLTMITCM